MLEGGGGKNQHSTEEKRDNIMAGTLHKEADNAAASADVLLPF